VDASPATDGPLFSDPVHAAAARVSFGAHLLLRIYRVRSVRGLTSTPPLLSCGFLSCRFTDALGYLQLFQADLSSRFRDAVVGIGSLADGWRVRRSAQKPRSMWMVPLSAASTARSGLLRLPSDFLALATGIRAGWRFHPREIGRFSRKPFYSIRRSDLCKHGSMDRLVASAIEPFTLTLK
jgi:hypothetical protein